MTPHVQPLADAFQNAKCGSGTWKVGEEQRTTDTGCLFFRPTSACSTDHDIVRVEGPQLFFGQRPARQRHVHPGEAAGRPDPRRRREALSPRRGRASRAPDARQHGSEASGGTGEGAAPSLLSQG